jgi:serine phosphatase RsbU (regulator of sigma subunit)/CHASE2 domain-containing sensor protein
MTDSRSPSEETAAERGRFRTLLAAPGRATALAVLGVLILVRLLDSGLLEAIAWRVFDWQQQLAPRHHESSPVSIVAIDENSLARYGQWPWPRTLIARLVRQIAAAQPRVLAVDILFPEPDRLSPGRLVEVVPDLPTSLARDLAALPPNEAALAEAFRMVPTVLGVGHPLDDASLTEREPPRLTPVREAGADPRPFIKTLIGDAHDDRSRPLLYSLPELTAAQRGSGAIISADPSGIMRCVPLFVPSHTNLEPPLKPNLVPTLALEALRVAFDVRTLGISTAADGIRGATIGDVFIPTDQHGCAYPHFSERPEERFISAADLLDGKISAADALRDGLVFLGVTGLGLVDLWRTPMGSMYGTEIQAQLVESVLAGEILARPPQLRRIEVALLLVAGLITIFALPYRRAWPACTGFFALAALIAGIALASFSFYKLMLDGVYPVLASGIVFGVLLAANLRASQVESRSLAAALDRERQDQALLQGELDAARSIQLGMLPRAFERADLEVFALLESAQLLGGDLYDFLLTDSGQLSFAIADVSGKGVPAALFMMMTKEVLRDATARHGTALDRVLAEANMKISAADHDTVGGDANLMYVTVFAGMLDLGSGRLTYANAGHDAPFILSRDARPFHLVGEGGPPLGTVDDFPYPLEHRQLSPGDMLLLYTDGVTETENGSQALYSTARLAQLLSSAPAESARSVVDFVREDVRQFSNGAEQTDDITLLAIRWIGPGAAAG